MSDDLIDKQLIRKAKKGNKYAFEALVIKYQFRVCSIIGRYIKDQNEVRDVAQEVFIKIYRSLKNFRGDSNFYTWIYRISVNSAKNFLIHKKVKVSTIDLLDFDEYINSKNIGDNEIPEHVLFAKEMEEMVFSIINDLTTELKTTFILREIDGRTYDEIASIVNCPVGTVRSRIHRAREIINKSLDPYLKKSG